MQHFMTAATRRLIDRNDSFAVTTRGRAIPEPRFSHALFTNTFNSKRIEHGLQQFSVANDHAVFGAVFARLVVDDSESAAGVLLG